MYHPHYDPPAYRPSQHTPTTNDPTALCGAIVRRANRKPHSIMAKVTLFPMNRTESGNLVLQSVDFSSLNGTCLVFVDALRAAHFGISQRVTKTWVECRDSNEMDYPTFCNEHAIEVHNVEMLPYMDRDSGEPWTTEEGKPWFGLVRP